MRLSKWGVITCGIYLGLKLFILTRFVPWQHLGSITWAGAAQMWNYMSITKEFTGALCGGILVYAIPESIVSEHKWMRSWPIMHAISYIVLYFIGRFAEWFYVRLNEG